MDKPQLKLRAQSLLRNSSKDPLCKMSPLKVEFKIPKMTNLKFQNKTIEDVLR